MGEGDVVKVEVIVVSTPVVGDGAVLLGEASSLLLHALTSTSASTPKTVCRRERAMPLRTPTGNPAFVAQRIRSSANSWSVEVVDTRAQWDPLSQSRVGFAAMSTKGILDRPRGEYFSGCPRHR